MLSIAERSEKGSHSPTENRRVYSSGEGRENIALWAKSLITHEYL